MLIILITYSPLFSLSHLFFFLQPLHRELYTHEANFFVPSFLKAIAENTEESFRSIMVEPSPGIYTFEMLQPRFCELLLSEVSSAFLHVFCMKDLDFFLSYSFFILCFLIRFWLLRWKILKDGSMRKNSESCDLTQWTDMVLFLMTLDLKPCLKS